MLICRMMLRNIVFINSFPVFHATIKLFKVFLSRIQKYCIFVACDHCCFIVLFAISEALLLSIHTFVLICRWPISSNVFCRMMTSLPVTKHPPVSASVAEEATSFKMMKFTYIGPLRRYRAHFEGMLPKKNILQINRMIMVKSDMMHRCQHIKSCLKREI